MPFPDTDLDVTVLAYLGADPNDDPGTWPSPVDLSSRLLDRDVTVTSGRRSGQRTAAAGSATLWLDNDDGALTPLHPSSPYYGTWDLGVPVALDVDGVGASPPYGLFRGYVASIEPEIRPTVGGGSTSVVRVTLGGVLRRLGQGGVAQSAMRRLVDANAPRAYWPLSDGPDASQGQALTPNTKRIQVVYAAGQTGSAFFGRADGASTLADWLEPALALEGTVILAGDVPGEIGGTFPALAADVAFRLEGEIGSSAAWSLGLEAIAEEGGNVYRYYAILDGAGPSLELYREDEALAATLLDTADASAVQSLIDGRVHHLRVAALQVGGTGVSVQAFLDGVQIMSGGHLFASLAPADRTPQWRVVSLGEIRPVIGHAMAWVEATDVIDPEEVHTALLGHPGETDVDRIARICAEEGIPFTAWSPPVDGVPLGPQPIGDVLTVMRDAETAGQGRLYELTSTWGLGYRPLRSHYNQDPLMTVDLSSYRVTGRPEPLQPVRNDQRLRNEVTVSRPGGGEITVRDEPSIARHGRYKDPIAANLASDEDLPNWASWRLHVLTDSRSRHPTLPVDLGSNPTLLTAWLESRLGDRVDRTSHPQQHIPDDMSMIVEGYTQTLRRRNWAAQLVVEPYGPYRVGTYAEDDADADDEPVSRYDTAGCETAAGVWFPSGFAGSVSTPNHADLQITGDLDLRVDISPQAWASGTPQTLVEKYGTGSERAYALRLTADGFLNLLYSTDGSTDTSVTSTVPLPHGSSRLTVRATLDVDNGSGGRTVTFYTGTSTGAVETQLGSAVTTAGTVTVNAGTEPLQVGVRGVNAQPFAGIIHAAQVRSGISGTIVANARFEDEATADTSFTDSAGRTWTLTGDPAIFHDFAAGTDTDLLVLTEVGQRWTDDTDDLPMVLRVAGVDLEVTAVAGPGQPQLLTVSATPVNGVTKTIEPGESISLADPDVYAL